MDGMWYLLLACLTLTLIASLALTLWARASLWLYVLGPAQACLFGNNFALTKLVTWSGIGFFVLITIFTVLWVRSVRLALWDWRGA